MRTTGASAAPAPRHGAAARARNEEVCDAHQHRPGVAVLRPVGPDRERQIVTAGPTAGHEPGAAPIGCHQIPGPYIPVGMLSRSYGFTMASTPKPRAVKRGDGRRAEARGTRAREVAGLSRQGLRGARLPRNVGRPRRRGCRRNQGRSLLAFKNKEELFFALIEERVDRRARELMQITETAPKEHETAPTVSRGTANLVDAEPELILLTHEYWSLAVREPSCWSATSNANARSHKHSHARWRHATRPPACRSPSSYEARDSDHRPPPTAWRWTASPT